MDIKFSTSKRDGNIALWINYGAGNWNIWDIPQDSATPDVLKAITAAFQMGLQAHSFKVTKVLAQDYDIIEPEWEVKDV